MRKIGRQSGRGQNTIRGGRTPSRRKIAARSLRASGVTPASCCWKTQLVFWPRRKGIGEFVRQDVRQHRKEEPKESMAIIKAPPKQPKSVTIQARVEESVKTQLDQYAKFIDATPSYVITEALKVLFKRDDEFKAWLGQHTNSQNSGQNQGEALTKTP
jgi:predicted transcriptional regulator